MNRSKRMPRGRGQKNHTFVVLQRKERIGRWYCEGKSQNEIAELENTSQTTVSNTLKELHEDWLESARASYEVRKARELANIDHLERLAAEAWKKSTKNAEVEVTKIKRALRKAKAEINGNGKDSKRSALANVLPNPEVFDLVVVGDEVNKTVKGQTGDPRFLEIMSSCIEMRAKICGLFQDVNVNIDARTSVNVWDALASGKPPLIIEAKYMEIEKKEGEGA